MTSGLGAFGETWAAGLLTRLGYRVVDRNVRFPRGEIDLVAWDGQELVFVEVKCRRSRRYGSPAGSITRARFGRLATAIALYLQEKDLDPDSYRVDVVSILVGPGGRVEWHEVLKGVEAP